MYLQLLVLEMQNLAHQQTLILALTRMLTRTVAQMVASTLAVALRQVRDAQQGSRSRVRVKEEINLNETCMKVLTRA